MRRRQIPPRSQADPTRMQLLSDPSRSSVAGHPRRVMSTHSANSTLSEEVVSLAAVVVDSISMVEVVVLVELVVEVLVLVELVLVLVDTPAVSVVADIVGSDAESIDVGLGVEV